MSETYKVVVLGSGGVGKTTLTIQFIHGKCLEESDPTIEYSYRKQVEVDGQLCTLDILDMAGLEEYSYIRAQHLRTGHAFILMYDCTNADSLGYLSNVQGQMDEEEQKPVLMLGNKSDLQEMRKVSYEDGQKFAQTFKNCDFLETSAKEGTNVDEAFKCIARRLLKKYRKEETIQKNGTSCVLS